MITFVLNPKAKKAAGVQSLIEERMAREGLEYEFLSGESKEETRSLLLEKTKEEGVHRIVAVGGDGTLNDVLSGLSDPARVELGLVPVGTGNDFAVAAGIPEGAAALDLIVKGEAKPTDFIECPNGLRSMNIAGLGIDVDILERCARMKHGGSKGKYFRSLLVSLFRYKGERIEVSVNGENFSLDAYVAAVCNGVQFGGGIRICPPAKLDDGKLDLVVVRSPKRWKLLIELGYLMRGKILSRPISRHILCEEARIVRVDGNAVQLDGEIVGTRVLDAKIVSGKLKMYRG